jgi:CubicO group peptidase (beta-lactamase class C family)
MPFEQFLQERIFDPLEMKDTGFFVAPAKAHRLAACYSASPQGAMTFHATDRKGGLTLQDDPATSSFLSPPSLISGGGGLCSTAADYLTFCRALLNGGELGGVRLVGPKTLALMTSNHLPGGRTLPELSRSLFSEATYDGMGFGLGFSVVLDPAKALLPGSRGEYAWGGAATTSFWIDPAEQLIAIFMTQVLPSTATAIRRELRTMIYAAITESNL